MAYKTLIRPLITYAAPKWYNISSSYMEKLRKLDVYELVRLGIESCII